MNEIKWAELCGDVVEGMWTLMKGKSSQMVTNRGCSGDPAFHAR
jgi:hypothetical protein